MLEVVEGKGGHIKRMEPMQGAIWRTFGILVVAEVLLSLTLVCAIGSSTISAAQASANGAPDPVTLIDEIEHLPAPSWKAIPLSLANDGLVSVDVQVLRGNLIDVVLTTPHQLGRIKRGDWNNLKSCGDVRATKARSYQHTGRLSKGNYYLVVSDMSVGLPSSSRSDVSTRVQVNLRYSQIAR